MGIPKFYRWLSERFPCVNQPISEMNVPIIDNLYLDMNGIVHNCTHGNDPAVKLTEEQMVEKIFMYLDRLMSIVQPQKLLFMAIDGVAPRAKMNQQRSRRFKTAKERKEAEAELIRKGEMVEGGGFDSNCITPGTAFMDRLNAHLRFFIRKKISEDSLWQKPTIILSGHDVPGEGEHKIMECIRKAKNRPDYEPNQRHCMYGLDADLIMLSLVTHEPHFCLLREVVSFGGGGKGRPAREVLENPCAEHFVLFHLGLVRDYLEVEFKPFFNKDSMPTLKFELERIVDDFVLFCMLIGNDFLPALPTLDVNEGALDKIFAIYKSILPKMGGYLTDGGTLNRGRFELLLQELAALESETLEQRAADAEEFESRRSRGNRGFGDGRPPGPGSLPSRPVKSELDEEDELDVEIAAATLGEASLDDLALMVELEGEEEPVAAAPTMMSKEARQLFLSGDPNAGLQAWKKRYYTEKLDCHTPAERRAVAEAYVAGLLWVLDYYYQGVSSWTWFYPHHYSPMCSDLVNLDSIHVKFELGSPFLPFQQLLAVLPALSSDLLPKPYKELMTSPSSPIVDFYPESFRIDLEGKRADWEGIVLVPFIDEARLLAAEATITPDKLSAEERRRNVLGDILIFTFAENSTDTEFCTPTLPSCRHPFTCNSRCTRQPPPTALSKKEKGFLPVLVKGTIVGKGGPPGFPTLKILRFQSGLKAVGVDILGIPSKKESVILQLMDPTQGQPPSPQVAGESTLGQHCWIRWPYLTEAVVEGVSNSSETVTKEGSKIHSKEEEQEWIRNADKLTRDFLVKKGVELGTINLLFHVRPCQGLVRRTDGVIEKRFSKDTVLHPMQATLRRNVSMRDPRLDTELATARLANLKLPVDSKALFVARANYGALATVLPDPSPGLSKEGKPLPSEAAPGMLHIRIEPTTPAVIAAASTAKRILASVKVQYEPSGLVARKLGMFPRILGKVTGNLHVEEGDEKFDIGLCVKHGGRGMCVPDYVQPAPDDRGWLFSPALINVLLEYKKKFPWVFSFLEENQEEGMMFSGSDMLPDLSPADRLEALGKLKKWIKQLPLSRRPLVKTSAKVAPEHVIKSLQAALPAMPAQPPVPIELENVAPWLLLSPVDPHSHIAAELAGGEFELGDRVVSLTSKGSPPLGLRGTIVGIHDDACEVLFDVEFPGGTDLHGRCLGHCGMIMPANQLLNTSNPRAINVTGNLAPRIVRKARSTNENNQAQPLSQANGSAARVEEQPTTWPAKTSESINGNEKPPQLAGLTPEKARPRVHIPLAPGSPSQRGFGIGRGRPQPGAPQGSGTTPPGAEGVHNFFSSNRHKVPTQPSRGEPLSQNTSSLTATPNRAAGQALLALVKRDTTPSASPAGGSHRDLSNQHTRSDTPPPAAVTPPGVHHSPFGHIRPPLQIVSRSYAAYLPPPGLPLPKKLSPPEDAPTDEDDIPLRYLVPDGRPPPAAANVFKHASSHVSLPDLVTSVGSTVAVPRRNVTQNVKEPGQGLDSANTPSDASEKTLSPTDSSSVDSIFKPCHQQSLRRPPGLPPAKHAPYSIPLKGAPFADVPSAGTMMGPHTPRQSPAATPVHTLLPSPSDDLDGEAPDHKGEAPGETMFIFADMDFPALPPHPLPDRGRQDAPRNGWGAPTGTPSVSGPTPPAVVWQHLQQLGATSSVPSAKTPPAPAPHPLLAQLRRSSAPPPASTSWPLPPPVTLPPPNLLPRPVTLPRPPSGAALLEKLKRGPAVVGDPGKAILQSIQGGSAPGPSPSSGNVDELAKAARVYLESRRGDPQRFTAHRSQRVAKPSAKPLPKPAPVDMTQAGHAARLAANNALKGAEAVSRSHSSSTSPRSPVDGPPTFGHAPLIISDEQVHKAKTAANTALRGVKDGAVKASAPDPAAIAGLSAKAADPSALLKGALGIGTPRANGARPVGMDVDTEATRKAVADALKGLRTASTAASESHKASDVRAREDTTPSTGEGSSQSSTAAKDATPAEFWTHLQNSS
eukprot:jgi/Botrbrau1/561/Bobra.0010s0030.1